MENLKVLAVADPAVSVYIDKGYHILEDFQEKDIRSSLTLYHGKTILIP